MDEVLLYKVLEIIITKALPMIAVYWILERPFIDLWLNTLKDFFQEKLGLSISAVKRVIAIVASVVISVGLYSLYAGLGYAVMPNSFETWMNLILTLGSINFMGSQVIQAKDLSFK